MVKFTKFSIIFAAIIFATYSIAFSYDDPNPAKTFYGDASGNMTLELNDVTVNNNFILFGDGAYDTPQPNTLTQKDDTCDVFPDGVCQLSDITQMKNAILGSQFGTVWNSWEILDIDLPASASVGIKESFHLNVRGILGGTPWGRPGIIVKLTVAPDSVVSAASVFGRTCTGPPECAVSVSITDMPNDNENSTTESDADGFSFRGDEAGTLTLLAEFNSQFLFNIPATSVRFNVTIDAGSNVWYVNDDAPAGGDGLSWATAFQTVQEAVDAASAGEQVWVADGTYSTGATTSVLTMKDGVEVYGGFVGTETLLSERGDPALFPTVLDGLDVSYHVVVGADDSILDGFTIEDGNAVGSAPDNRGAGIYIEGISNLTIAECIVRNNYAAQKGGGIFVTGNSSGITISNCVISGNTANSGSGGGMSSEDKSSVIIDNCVFDGNSADNNGGGINAFDGSEITITSCLFFGNIAEGTYGGAISCNFSTLDCYNLTISGNSANNGGAVSIRGPSNATLTNSISWGNTAPTNPEIHNDATITVEYSDIEGGYAGTGNIDQTPEFINAPFFWDITAAGGTTTTVTVNDSAPYAVNDVIEIDNDGVARTVSASGGGTVTFSPALSSASVVDTTVSNWGVGATDMAEDFRLSQVAAGEGSDSPCVDVGSDTAFNLGMSIYSTRSDGLTDSGQVDMGYHYSPFDAPVIISSPGDAVENTPYTYNITCEDAESDPLTLALSAGDTCGGAVTDNGDGTGTYDSWTPGELAGGTTCVVGVECDDGPNTDTEDITINIIEDNQAPAISSNAPTTATENTLYSYPITCTDADLPAQTLTLTIGAGDTCEYELVDNGGGTGTYSFSPGETHGGTTCDVMVTCTDDFAPPASDTEGPVTVTIAEDNQTPYWTSPVSDIFLNVNQAYSNINGQAADDDQPGQTLTCTNDGDDCSFPVTVSGSGTSAADCTVSFTSGPLDETCAVSVKVDDGNGGAIFDLININVNMMQPTIDCSIPGPNPVDEGAMIICQLVAIAGINEVGLADTCGGLVVGLEYQYIPTEAQGPGSCIAGVQNMLFPAFTAQDTVNINEVNQPPVWNPLPSDIVVAVGGTYNQTNGHADDTDLPLNTLTCSMTGTTCSGNSLISVTGSGPGLTDCAITVGFVIPIPETCTLDVQIDDGNGGIITDTVNVYITDNTVSIDCSNPGPNPVDEGSMIQCAVATTGGPPQVDAGNDTCGGVLNAGFYEYTPMKAWAGAVVWRPSRTVP